MALDGKAKGYDFLKEFDWRKNTEIVSSKLDGMLKDDKDIQISKFSVEEEDNDYYISMLIGFKRTDNVAYTNQTSYGCHMSKDKYRTFISLYTAPCENAGFYATHTIHEHTLIKEPISGWSNIDDIVSFLASLIRRDINGLKEMFLPVKNKQAK